MTVFVNYLIPIKYYFIIFITPTHLWDKKHFVVLIIYMMWVLLIRN